MHRITFLLSLLFIFVVPWEDSISTSVWGSLARILGLVLAASWFATILLEGKLRRFLLFHFLALLFFIWNFVSLYWSRNIAGTNERLTTYSQTFLFLLIFWDTIQTADELRLALQAYVFGGFVLIAGTFYSYFNGIIAVAYEGRYSMPGVNAVELALSVILGLPIALHLFLGAGTGRLSTALKWLNLAYLPLSFFAAMLTGSRTSLIAVIPFCIYVAASGEISSQLRLRILGLLILALVVILPLIPPDLMARLGTAGASLSGGDIGGRVAIWRDAWNLFARHTLLGIGSGNLDATIGTVAHNTFVSVAAETGFIGFSLFMLVLASVVARALRARRPLVGFWLCLLATWAIGVMSLSWEFRKTTWVVFSLVVLGGSLLSDRQRQQGTLGALPMGGAVAPASKPELGSRPAE